MKKVKVRAPSGKITIHQRKEKPKVAKCANCKSPLHGMPRLLSNEFRKLSGSERRPDRPYGGHLCSDCTRDTFREQVRGV